MCLDVFGKVGFVSGHNLRGSLLSVRDRRGLVIMGKCSERST